MLYRQCKLRKNSVHTYMWLPSNLAAKRVSVGIRGESGWVVEKAWMVEQTEEQIVPRARDYTEELCSQ